MTDTDKSVSIDTSTKPSPPNSGSSLRWLDDLERDFDKSFVECDILLGDIDADQTDIVQECRQKMTGISSCFAQLVCKAQTLFHKNLKLEVSSDYRRRRPIVREILGTINYLQGHDKRCKCDKCNL